MTVIYRICSGQKSTDTGPDWGISLEDDRGAPWWRALDKTNRRQRVFRTPAAAQRAAFFLEINEPTPRGLAADPNGGWRDVR